MNSILRREFQNYITKMRLRTQPRHTVGLVRWYNSLTLISIAYVFTFQIQGLLIFHETWNGVRDDPKVEQNLAVALLINVTYTHKPIAMVVAHDIVLSFISPETKTPHPTDNTFLMPDKNHRHRIFVFHPPDGNGSTS